MHVKEPRTLIMEEQGFTLVFLVHIASALVYRFPQASELQCLSVLLRHPWFHYQKCIIIIIIIMMVALMRKCENAIILLVLSYFNVKFLSSDDRNSFWKIFCKIDSNNST